MLYSVKCTRKRRIVDYLLESQVCSEIDDAKEKKKDRIIIVLSP